MKQLSTIIFLFGFFLNSYAQTESIIHHGGFKKGRVLMSSNQYKPDKWEKDFYENSIKTAFPSDLIKNPDQYSDQLIQLIGIVDSVYVDNDKNLTFILENKYWDYIEDYSIQDEKMFVSDKGDGKFMVTVSNFNPEQIAAFKKFPTEKKLFLVYGNYKELSNNIPVLTAKLIKYFDHEVYSTSIFSYEILRDKNGNVELDKKGNSRITNFKFLKVAKAGQNK